MFGIFEFQLIVLKPLLSPYFQKESPVKKVTYILALLFGFWRILGDFKFFEKNKSKISVKKFLGDPMGAPYGYGLKHLYVRKLRKKYK